MSILKRRTGLMKIFIENKPSTPLSKEEIDSFSCEINQNVDAAPQLILKLKFKKKDLF